MHRETNKSINANGASKDFYSTDMKVTGWINEWRWGRKAYWDEFTYLSRMWAGGGLCVHACVHMWWDGLLEHSGERAAYPTVALIVACLTTGSNIRV